MIDLDTLNQYVDLTKLYNTLSQVNLSQFLFNQELLKVLGLLVVVWFSANVGNGMRQKFLEPSTRILTPQEIQAEMDYVRARNAGAFFSGVVTGGQ